jgi:outer membrane immunogenic protein
MRNKLLSSVAGAVFSFAASGLAIAADMPVKAPPVPPPAPVYNWTGWYVGVNAGASFGRAKTDFNAPATVAGTVNCPISRCTTPGSGTGTSTFGFAGSNTEYPDGFMGGGQIGYNWQYSPLIVVGLEADFQGALEKDNNTLTNSFNGRVSGATSSVPSFVFSLPVTGSTVLDYHTNIDWFGTARVRIGYVWGNGQVMSYVTGGLAYGEVKINGTTTVGGLVAASTPPVVPAPFFVSEAFGHSQVNTGWVVGYGTEGRLATPGWTWKVEGLWMDLGSIDTTGSGVGPSTTVGPFPPGLTLTGSATGQTTTHTHFTDGILRAGLNYQFH